MENSKADPPRGFARARDRAIFLSIGTSFVSKAGSLLLQLAALPVAIRTLGVEGFAVYTLCSGVLALLSFADLGAGPMMVRRIAGGVATQKEAQIGEALFSGLLTSLCAALILGLAVVLALAGALPGFGEGSVFADKRAEFYPAMLASLLAGLLQVAASWSTRLLAGYQLMHRVNLASALGVSIGAVSTIALSAAVEMRPWMLIVSVFLPPAALQIIVGCRVAAGKSLFAIAFRHGSIRKSWYMIGEGLAFATIGGVVPFLEREGSKWMTADRGDTLTVAHIGLGFHLVALLGGIITMVTSPLVAAIVDAEVRNEREWLSRRFGQVRFILIMIMVAVNLGGFALGPQIIGKVFGPTFILSQWLVLTICLCFAVYAWVQLHWTVVSSFGVIWGPALLGLTEAVVSLSWFALFPRAFDDVSIFMILTIVIAVSSGWVLPRLCRRLLHSPNAIRFTNAGDAKS